MSSLLNEAAAMSTPKEMKAITYHNAGDQCIKTIPLPELRPTYMLVKVEAVALNPTDWKAVTYLDAAKPFSIVGCDYAGTVISVGDKVTRRFKPGDRVFGCVHGANENESSDGAFAEYAVVKGDVTMHAPGNFSTEDLSTVGLGSITVGQGLFQAGNGLHQEAFKTGGMGLSMPGEGKGNGEWLLIYGGSTATGTLGIQYAKLAGYKIITTCSPRNFELVKSRGADEVFDYNDPECGAKIRKLTDNKLKFAWDTTGDGENICDAALSSDSSICHFGSILENDFPRKGVKHTSTLMYTMFGESFKKYGIDFPASKDDYEFAKTWTELTEKLLAARKIIPHPKKVGDGGLEGVLKGLEDLKEGRVSGEKLVYRI